MERSKTSAVAIGILFIIATVGSLIAAGFVAPALGEADLLAAVGGAPGTMQLGALMMFIAALSGIGIAVTSYPVLRQHDLLTAVCFLVFRLTSDIIYVVGGIVLLILVAFGQIYVAASAPDASVFGPVGDLLRVAMDITFNIGTLVVFSISAMVLGWALLRSRLVPGWLGIWMLAGGVLLEIEGLLIMFGMHLGTAGEAVLSLPIALGEMVFAIWLIVKGFDLSEIESGA